MLNCITVCTLDVNKDRRIDVQDLFEFLNAWFTGLPAGDFNRSGGNDVSDLFDYLNAWFTAGRSSC
ncbi:MAG: hypothetical protein K2W85_05075 [Phycisphaerales bacterium]|nr:hypothetical protein [Phycisphaerales bacterium]